jgi:predicted transcriptional regulator
MRQVSDTEQVLIDRFETAYNRIKRLMEREVNGSKEDSFVHLVNKMQTKRKLFISQVQFLKSSASLRNHIVHETMQPGEYLSVPRASIVKKLEDTADRMEKPPVVAMFNTDVLTFHTTDTVATVLHTIHETDFSQFPIYDEDDHFVGLLTENGIVRWLADHNLKEGADLADLERTVEQALRVQEVPQNYQFVARDMTTIEAVNIYARYPQLEALLITETGDKQQTLTGIMTRFDALDIVDDERHTDNGQAD